jgi:hypothetical protein
MSEFNVTSHNQSGGVTAGQIGAPSPHSPRPIPPKPRVWKRILVVIVAVITFAASVVAVLEYIGVGPFHMTEKDKSQTINVTSNHQSGGITAGVVNVGPQRRHFTEKDAQHLTQAIPKGSDVTVTATMTSDEALAFAFEIYHWMKENGYPKIQGPNSAMWTQPVFGQVIRQNGEKYEILIGTAN